MRRASAALAVTVTMLAVGAAPAGAIPPPQVDPATPTPNGSAGPIGALAQRNPCVTSTAIPGTEPFASDVNASALNLSQAWTHSRGEGQTVAVLDTGVRPGPRLPDVEAGGDYVASGDGLTDCDGHGTLVAGLIAGQPGADGFSGVAPDARILSIRVASPRYAPRDGGEDPALTRAALDTQAMAAAIVRAADQGARVISISAVTCVPVGKNFDQDGLGAALRYAAVDKDVVIVAAAGDNGPACESNPPSDPALPADPRNWSGVSAVSIPAWWHEYVLSVGSLGSDGRPSSFTMAGPWVGIAAPGENITSVSNDDTGGLANGLPAEQDRIDPVRGTGYATAYVAGVAALVRSRFPELPARQVIERLTGTAQSAARSPSNLVGAGRVDPVAALTWNVPDTNDIDPAAVKPIAAPPPPPPHDPVPRAVAFTGAGVLALVVLAVAVSSARRKETSS
ncbi:type VII secretion-associated serine protease mycosin [Mycobacterium sp. 4D054]|uniref:type VII secretion-associated serine protease mycosin n=1 Tax=unclassified Mycobacterium TaxID=2642494 RepID=UPI0028C435E8|nr:type VII secretion-associated serine protease mycosin [Mycobacterium sp. SMC-8]